jgi:hypothetical protein
MCKQKYINKIRMKEKSESSVHIWPQKKRTMILNRAKVLNNLDRFRV